jgi:FKBP-type peptidyl-prolyl cis-trans isomerase SlpA
MNIPIGIDSSVTLHLSLTLEDGTVAESTFGDEPLSFVMGDGTLVRGLELGLYGLRPGDTQRLELYPKQAFGLRDPDKIHKMLRAAFDDEMVLEPGVIIGFETPEGEEIPGMVRAVGDESVEVDFNHPLAGHTVIFDVKIIDVVPTEQGESD